MRIHKPEESFLFFYNFLQRQPLDDNISYTLETLQNHFINYTTATPAEETTDTQPQIYFELFRSYYNQFPTDAHLFWYVCILYFVQPIVLQRFFTFFMVQLWNVFETFQPLPYEKVRAMSKAEILLELQTFVEKNNEHLPMLIYAIQMFF